MEPLDDRELSQVLREWKAPPAPAHLQPPRQTSQRQPWWRWLMTGTIRIPAPVGLAAAIALVAAWVYSGAGRSEPAVAGEPPIMQHPVVSLADFQPVQEVELRVVGDVR